MTTDDVNIKKTSRMPKYNLIMIACFSLSPPILCQFVWNELAFKALSNVFPFKGNHFNMLLASSIYTSVFILPFIILINTKYLHRGYMLTRKPILTKLFPVHLLVSILLAFVISHLINLLFSSLWGAHSFVYSSILEINNSNKLFILLLYLPMFLLSAFTEEIYFREFLFVETSKVSHALISMTFSSIFFAWAHFSADRLNYSYTSFIFVVAFIFSISRLYSGTILISIMAHAILNSIQAVSIKL